MMDYFSNNEKANFGRLLGAVKLDGAFAPLFKADLLFENIDDNDICYQGAGRKEKALWQSKKYLIALIDHVSSGRYTPPKKQKLCEASMKNRQKLFAGDKETIKAAAQEIEAGKKSGWFILEGPTQPDIFIETEDYIIVVEAKWTERFTTTGTDNLTVRDQMLRHIQGALEHKKAAGCMEKKLVAFYIVDETFLHRKKNEYIKSKKAFRRQVENEAGVNKTIPLDEAEEIINAYVGYITWQSIKEAFPDMPIPFCCPDS